MVFGDAAMCSADLVLIEVDVWGDGVQIDLRYEV